LIFVLPSRPAYVDSLLGAWMLGLGVYSVFDMLIGERGGIDVLSEADV